MKKYMYFQVFQELDSQIYNVVNFNSMDEAIKFIKKYAKEGGYVKTSCCGYIMEFIKDNEMLYLDSGEVTVVFESDEELLKTLKYLKEIRLWLQGMGIEVHPNFDRLLVYYKPGYHFEVFGDQTKTEIEKLLLESINKQVIV
jgi:hypothetical protein